MNEDENTGLTKTQEQTETTMKMVPPCKMTNRSRALRLTAAISLLSSASVAARFGSLTSSRPQFHSSSFGAPRHRHAAISVRGGSSNLQEITYDPAANQGNSTDGILPSTNEESFEIETQVATYTTEPIDTEIATETDVKYQRALTKTAYTVAGAVLFGIGVMATRGVSSGYEFFAGYLIEQSLSIDNLFVFIMLFDYFKVPMELQNRVLSWGITGAILLRGLMIGVGVAALQKFKSVILVFAGILIASSVNLLLEKEHVDSGDGDENIIMKLTKLLFPNTSTELHGEDFFVKNDNGKNIATPLFLCLVCVELSDFVFAVDSIPAVLGVSKDPMIVYASNIFAIMALRSLYTVVAKAVSNFHYLKPAVALVLGFVGSKMIAEYFHIEIGTGTSLMVICTLLGSGVGASIWENKKRHESERQF